ncbi:short chain dehydrogenase [Nereida ignava]|uniref:Short chain dehydrogenase n=1 Tax=Nereida ignava TaxID=282199 RepID=A0A0U1NMX9_9RHOB|nr:hypothetical protein [Nereida ignava]CRK76091.1 short chain dehydrogenase [Nereida ignava]SFJ84824.1 hypothetical protein SAMN02745667_02570 [Nereida ignava DSM 16309]
MTTYLITGVNRGIGAALAAVATARGHTVLGTTHDGRDGTVPLTLDDPARIAAQLADIPQDCPLLKRVSSFAFPVKKETFDHA